jgi:hypothetical protein
MSTQSRVTRGPSDETPWPCRRMPGDSGAYCNHPECNLIPLALDPPPAPPAAVRTAPTVEQQIRMAALAAATASSGPRDPYDLLRDAKRYVRWITEGA